MLGFKFTAEKSNNHIKELAISLFINRMISSTSLFVLNSL